MKKRAEPEELMALKLLGLKGAKTGVKTTCSELSDGLDISEQTVSRRLRKLEELEMIKREAKADGQWIEISDKGIEELRGEYEDYRRIFEVKKKIDLSGEVTTGMGEGKYYISLEGYSKQFREKLGYEPFPGTLNIDLNDESIRKKKSLSYVDGIKIEEWEDEERSYGAAICYPASISNGGKEKQVKGHVIEPKRTHHSRSTLELISPMKLLDELELEEGEKVKVEIEI